MILKFSAGGGNGVYGDVGGALDKVLSWIHIAITRELPQSTVQTHTS